MVRAAVRRPGARTGSVGLRGGGASCAGCSAAPSTPRTSATWPPRRAAVDALGPRRARRHRRARPPAQATPPLAPTAAAARRDGPGGLRGARPRRRERPRAAPRRAPPTRSTRSRRSLAEDPGDRARGRRRAPTPRPGSRRWHRAGDLAALVDVADRAAAGRRRRRPSGLFGARGAHGRPSTSRARGSARPWRRGPTRPGLVPLGVVRILLTHPLYAP